MHFGATLRLLRLDSGLSLRDLARRLDVSSAYLSRVENGLDAAPTPARLAVMARELGLPAQVLMDLAHRVSPLVVDYVMQVPEAGSLFLDIAHRRLDAGQLAELRMLLDERFPPAGMKSTAPALGLARLLRTDRIVLGLTCSGMEDILDVAAETPDGAPLQVVIVLVGPRDVPERRLVLAQIARLAARRLTERLVDAGTPDEVRRRILLPG